MKLLLRIRPHEFVFAKCLPLAVLNLPDQGGPGLRLRIEREAVRQFAVIKLDFEREQFVVDCSPPERRFRGTEIVHPMADVTFPRRIEPDKDIRLILREHSHISILQFDPLMIQRPLRVHDIFCCLPVWKSARHVPLANEPIEKRVV